MKVRVTQDARAGRWCDADLDALLALCDRIVVMSEGRVLFEVNPSEADRKVLGAHIDGNIHHSTTLKQERAAA